MDDQWKLFGAMGDAMGAMATAYKHVAKQKPTIEELQSDLDAAIESHGQANRALTNVSVQLSSALDRLCEAQNQLRKTKLAHTREINALDEMVASLNGQLATERKRAEVAEKSLAQKSSPPPPIGGNLVSDQ